MANSLQVGQSVPLSIAFLDQSGNPMETVPTPDSPPSWTSNAPNIETLTVADGGLTATLTGVAAGDDVVALSLSVGGVAFSTNIAVTVTTEAPPAQVLTSIGIVFGTPVPAASAS